MPQEIKIDGIGISPDVLTAIVSRAVSDVEGIASVGVKDLATNLVSMMLSSKAPASEPAVRPWSSATSSALTGAGRGVLWLSVQERRRGRSRRRGRCHRCSGRRSGRAHCRFIDGLVAPEVTFEP